MTQPRYAPITEEARVRLGYRLQTPSDWRTTRAAELRLPENPRGAEFGITGPDQGYALLVAEELFADRLQLSPGISTKDALDGAAAVACARAGRFGRAPVAKDLEFAFVLFGFLGDPPADLVAWRTTLFQGAAHEYFARRRIVDSVREETLRLTPAQLGERLSDWRTLVMTGEPAVSGDEDTDPTGSSGS